MNFIETVSLAGYAVEGTGVFVMISGLIISSVIFLKDFKRSALGIAYRSYRRQMGRSIILGLEFLIAGDIIRTVVVENTLENIAVLGLIILIRTFLGMTLHLEVEGRWPWQPHPEKPSDNH